VGSLEGCKVTATIVTSQGNEPASSTGNLGFRVAADLVATGW
jgi:hypothetical protein